MVAPDFTGNRTIDILSKAEHEGYGVLAQVWYPRIPMFFTLTSNNDNLHNSYDAGMAIAFVRAAERCRSPAILMLFPVTLTYGKGPFIRFCLDMYVCSILSLLLTLRFLFCIHSAHQASVPIAVHLDHAVDPEHIELALSLAEQGIAFDSIMIDASHAEVHLNQV